MIVDPDFFNHWKTLILIGELDDDQLAPVYVLRLWAHCQNRRDCRFKLSAKALKALCHYSGHPDKLLAGLVASGFVETLDDGEIYVRGWDEYNAQLIANWENGKKGGRPKKPRKPDANPPDPDAIPIGNPPETHQEPIRVDRSREDNSLSPLMSNSNFAASWKRWRKHLNEKFKPLTQTSEEGQLMELSRVCCGDADDASALVEFTISRGALNLITSGEHKQEKKSQTQPRRSMYD